jgi:hypothetical protein
MHIASQWQQVPTFEPDNPYQQIQEHYTGLPGGYSSYYWNQVSPSFAGAAAPTWLTPTTGLVIGGLGLIGLGLILLLKR